MPDENEITTANMEHPASMLHLGRVLVANLVAAGRAGFYIDKDSAVVAASPFYTYFDPRVCVDVPEGKYKKVRPIITDGKPVFVIIEDGQMWEIEFEEE